MTIFLGVALAVTLCFMAISIIGAVATGIKGFLEFVLVFTFVVASVLIIKVLFTGSFVLY